MTNPIMSPWFSPRATIASLTTFIIAIATVLASLPHSLFTDAGISATLVAQVDLAAVIIAGTAGSHLAFSRSVLPSVDGTKTVEVPAPSTVTVETPPTSI